MPLSSRAIDISARRDKILIPEKQRMAMILHITMVLLSVTTLATSLRLMEWPPLNCTQEGLRCNANISDCSDSGWMRPNDKTPTSPAWASGRDRDEADGSINALQGAKVHVMEISSNESLCVRYIFHNKIPMVNPQRKPWTFSLERVVVEPGQRYFISISHLPVPYIGHNRIEKNITVPECTHSRLQRAKVCLETGSQWKPNVACNVSTEQEITVRFNSGEFSEKYIVSVQCPGFRDSQTVWKENQTLLNVTFTMDRWHQTCCEFDISIQPFFPRCKNDCIHKERYEHCVHEPPYRDGPIAIILILVLLLAFGCFAFILYKRTRTGFHVRKNHPQDSSCNTSVSPIPVCQQELIQERDLKKLLIIYSLDHPLYKDIVLKLCAFLRAKCGIEVVLDLLDGAWLGTVGRMQWLDWQKQQIEKSSDKILILCSRGVRAKWKAMCGEGRVILREDTHSPTGDMLTPALNLIIPDFVHSSSFQKYMVAYFEDVSCEDDVPAPFNITIKYKLMKHFEELYFRILGKEKHEPGRVNRIEGIAQDEYFNCPSGRALRDAIETLQAYQLENPDWFEKECVESEDEVAESDSQHPLLADTCNPIFQFVPECKEGPPVLVNTIEVKEDPTAVQTLIPQVNPGGERISTHEFYPGLYPSESQLYYSQPVFQGDPMIASIHPSTSESQPCLKSHPVIQESPASMRNIPEFLLEEGAARHNFPVEDHEEIPVSNGHLSPNAQRHLQLVQQSQGPEENVNSFPQEVVDHTNRPPSGSDQGYSSRSSVHHDATLGDGSQWSPLDALSRLQEACLLNSFDPLRDLAFRTGEGFASDHHNI
ncbi:hypothetical protein AGOR_G00248020 [Albula goreensis]|uniref:SEFIR domain-containing protein n=1 Tax=Albula goreensis TaxID=1534307 RepID=A0A8T3CHD1_9TELE|nr:hypothetical protein AGOR_G00248020 [Albula goreensis]